MALKNQERRFVNKFKAQPVRQTGVTLIDSSGAFVRDIDTDFRALLPSGLGAARFDGFFAPIMPFPTLLEETHEYAQDFLYSARYLFGNQASPCFLKAIQELQKEAQNFQDSPKVVDLIKKTMRQLYQELELREMLYYKMKMSQTVLGAT